MATSQTEVSLVWNDMTGATSYTVNRYANSNDADNDDNATPLTCADDSENACMSDELVASTTYYYRVSASNASGTSALSTAVSSATYPNVPSTPTGLVATPNGQSQITLDWDAIAGATSYVVQSYASSENADDNVSGTILTCANDSANTCVNDDLEANTTYYYRVLASNIGGVSALATAVSATTYPNPPSAPSDLVATTDGADAIDLTWTDNADNETGFLIERSDGDDEEFVQIDTAAVNATTYSDTSCDPETTYYYRVRAFNAGGHSSYSNIDSDTTEEAPVSSCSNTTTIGAVCVEGGLYAGTYNGFTYMTTGSNCGNDPNEPTCDEHPNPASRAADTFEYVYGIYGENHNASSDTDGVANTAAILAAEPSNSAALFCDQLNYASYTDWYWPAKNEVDSVLYANQDALGGVSAGYWASTQSGSNGGWFQLFSNGGWHSIGKDAGAQVRCVRKF